jgi:hypothetical protein
VVYLAYLKFLTGITSHGSAFFSYYLKVEREISELNVWSIYTEGIKLINEVFIINKNDSNELGKKKKIKIKREVKK